jgi:hypothetical protein
LDPSGKSSDTPPPSDGEPQRSGRLGRWFDVRFASRRRAIAALAASFVAFHVVAWALHEITSEGHRAEASLLAHLRRLPDEILLQVLFLPQALHFAIPALFHRGNLFEWKPGFWTTRIFAVLFWSTLLATANALVKSRRLAWCFLVLLLLLASTPRYVELIFVALSEG